MRRSPIMNSPVLKGDRHARVAEPIPRPMVLQISRGVGAEVSKTSDLRRDATWGWENRSGVVPAVRRGVGGGTRAVGSRACLAGHSTEVECREHGGVLDREVGDPHSSGVSGAAAQRHGLPLLGARVLRQHRGSTRDRLPSRSMDKRLGQGRHGSLSCRLGHSSRSRVR